jgi:hypothetical protein
MRDNNYNPDCVIVCRNGTIPFHRDYLILYSEYFDVYFNEKNAFNDSFDEIKLDTDTIPFQIITNYIYDYQVKPIYELNNYNQALLICDIYIISDDIKYQIKRKYEKLLLLNMPYKYTIEPKDDDVLLGCINRNLKDLDLNDSWQLSSFNNDTKYDTDVRSSFTYYTNRLEIGRELYDTAIRENPGYIMKLGSATLLKYIPGSEFKEHIDTFQENNYDQYGSVLFIKYSDDAIGGDLIVNDKIAVSAELGRNKWIYYYMPLNVTHHITKLKKGLKYCISIPVSQRQRIVFQTSVSRQSLRTNPLLSFSAAANTN